MEFLFIIILEELFCAFKIKWSKSEKKHTFVGMLGWRGLTKVPPPPKKKRTGGICHRYQAFRIAPAVEIP